MKRNGIINLQKIKLGYEIDNIDEIKSKGNAHLKVNVDIEKGDMEYNVAYLEYDFKITSKDSDVDGNKDGKEIIGAKLSVKYKVTYHEIAKEIEEKALIYYLEPYVRKEINDMFFEIGLPTDILPYGLWNDVHEE